MKKKPSEASEITDHIISLSPLPYPLLFRSLGPLMVCPGPSDALQELSEGLAVLREVSEVEGLHEP